MRIATLQLSPRLGDVEGNIRRADRLLEVLERRVKGRGWGGSGAGINAGGSGGGLLDVLVLPEMAFSGYNFPSLKAIKPYLEPTEAGPTAQWARATARRLGCVVCVGYPEMAKAEGNGNGEEKDKENPSMSTNMNPPTETTSEPPLSTFAGNSNSQTIDSTRTDKKAHEPPPQPSEDGEEEKETPYTCIPKPPTHPNPNFNSSITITPTGTILSSYQKRFLYYTDVPWASEGRNGAGFFHLPLTTTTTTTTTQTKTIPTALGICMDINPYNFTAPPNAYEFANHVLSSGARLVLLPMAWLTRLGSEELRGARGEPDLETFRYWVERFWPVVRGCVDGSGEGETVLVFANRVGEEGGGVRIGGDGDGVARYAGSSCVVGVRRRGDKRGNGGEKVDLDEVDIVVWEMLGRAEEGVCLVDTEEEPRMVFRMRGGSGSDSDSE
ncbi:Carbon-nitrogen hydrolase [Onygenales sp. PD_10]|nr:Carbon-nitrogen hydrolase [Onygenales sp. PD_10]